MASENVEIVRGLYESFARREHERAFEVLDEQVVWDGRGLGVPDVDELYVGHERVRAFWRSWLSAWSEIDFTVETLEEPRDGFVVARISQRNRGRDTGIWIDVRPWEQLWTLEGGKVTKVEFRWVE